MAFCKASVHDEYVRGGKEMRQPESLRPPHNGISNENGSFVVA
jgi:hypothetical protein